MKLIRLHDWQARLYAQYHIMRSSPFQWGVNDCGPGLVANAVKAMTGLDFGVEYRGKYSCEKTAYKFLRSLGVKDLADIPPRHFEEIHPCMASVGDIGAVPVDNRFKHGLCVFDHDRIVSISEDNGYGTLPRDVAVRAWRI